MKRSFCLALVIAAAGLVATAAPHIESTISADSVACYDFVEVTLKITGMATPLPGTDAVVTGRFGPSGEAPVSLPGFCDAADGSVYRIRFMPTQPGTHDYAIDYVTAGRAHAVSGRFEATDGRRRGQVRPDPAFPGHFQWAGTGERFFWCGLEADALLLLDDAALEEAIEHLDRCRISGLSITLPSTSGAAAADLAAWARWDRLLMLARERSIVVALDPTLARNGDVQARLAAFSNVAWKSPATLALAVGDTRAAWQHVLQGGYCTARAIPGLGASRDATTGGALEPFVHLYDFFTGIPWWELRPEPGLVVALSPHASAAPPPQAFAARNAEGDLAAVYVAGGGVVTLKDEMLRDQLKPLWFSPRDGGMRNARALRNRVYRTPTAEDWVLLFRTPCNCSFRDFDNEFE